MEKNRNRVPIIITDLAGEKRHIGDFDKHDLTFYTDRRYSKHFFKTTQSWGLDHAMFREMVIKYGLRYVVINEKESKKRYRADRLTIEERCDFKQFGKNRLQIFLPTQFWEEI